MSQTAAAAPTPAFDLKDPSSYGHWTTITIRFADEDRMGHVNNSAYSVWVEAARVPLFMHFMQDTPKWLDTVLARQTINFWEETNYPGEVRVGGRLVAVGNRSVQSAYAVFRDDRCLASAECVNVFFDHRSRRSTDPTPELRAAMIEAIARPRS